MTHPSSQAERDAIVLYDHLLTTVVKLEIYNDATIERALDLLDEADIDLSVINHIQKLAQCIRGME